MRVYNKCLKSYHKNESNIKIQQAENDYSNLVKYVEKHVIHSLVCVTHQ